MAFQLLEAISAPDLGIFINGEDFAATQDMTEEFRQNVTYHPGFGVDGPVIRQVRNADENTVSFSALLLKDGVARGLNDEDTLRNLRDFQIITKRGAHHVAYNNCNWTRITVRSTVDTSTLECDVTIPGFSKLGSGATPG